MFRWIWKAGLKTTGLTTRFSENEKQERAKHQQQQHIQIQPIGELICCTLPFKV